MQEVLESRRGKFELKLTTMTICIAGLVAACDSFSILAHFIGYGLELQILDQQHPYQIFLFSKHDTNRKIELPDNVAVLFEINRNNQTVVIRVLLYAIFCPSYVDQYVLVSC